MVGKLGDWDSNKFLKLISKVIIPNKKHNAMHYSGEHHSLSVHRLQVERVLEEVCDSIRLVSSICYFYCSLKTRGEYRFPIIAAYVKSLIGGSLEK